MKPEPTPLRIASPWGLGIWKRRKNSWIGSSGSPGIWGICIWVRTGAVVVLMLTTAGPFCSTRALKSGSPPAVDLWTGCVWTCAVWACELDMVVSLPPAKPSTVAAAQRASITANFFLDIGSPAMISVTRLGQRKRFEVPLAPAPDTFCYGKTSLLLRFRGPRGLLAHHLVGARLLQDVGALLRADAQGKLNRR